MAKPLHEIMAESSAGLALANAKKKQDIADRKSYGLGNLEARMRQNTGTGGGTGMGPQMGAGRRRRRADAVVAAEGAAVAAPRRRGAARAEASCPGADRTKSKDSYGD